MWKGATFGGKCRHPSKSAQMNEYKTGGKKRSVLSVYLQYSMVGYWSLFICFKCFWRKKHSLFNHFKLFDILNHCNVSFPSLKVLSSNVIRYLIISKGLPFHFGKSSCYLWSSTPKQQLIWTTPAWHDAIDETYLDIWAWTRYLQENKRIMMLHKFGLV